MISPDDTFTIYLDAELPEDQRLPVVHRPALVYRFGTVAELREHQRKLMEITQLHGVEYTEALLDRARFNLVEARNLKRPDGTPTEDLAEVMTIRDLRILAQEYAVSAELSESDRKKSELPSPTSAAASAEPAATEAGA